MLGKKIKYYRLKKGLTSEELAKAVGCTKAAISLYESDSREPNTETIKKIANTLGVSWVQLLSRDSMNCEFNHISFRKKQAASKKDIELLKIDIEKECINRMSILNILGLINYKVFKPEKLSFDNELSINASIIRKTFGISANGPIYSIVNTLENAGIVVISFPCAEGIDGLNGTVNGIPYLFFNANIKTIERKRFTIIHEVCHLFFDDSNDTLREKEVEKYINKLAGVVLIPTEDIYQIFGKTNRNISVYLRNEISKKYKIAPSCLIIRLFDEGVVTSTYHRNFFIFLNRNGGRKSEPTLLNTAADSEEPSLFKHQVYLALGNELISASRAAELLNVSLYDVMKNMRVE